MLFAFLGLSLAGCADWFVIVCAGLVFALVVDWFRLRMGLLL